MTLKELREVMSIGTRVEIYMMDERNEPESMYEGHIRFAPKTLDEYKVLHFHVTSNTLEIKVHNPAVLVSAIQNEEPSFFRDAIELSL